MSYPIIALWSHPRSMSTAFERIMRARGDLECLHEPFMYDYYVNRAKRKMPHFEVQEGHPQSYEDITGMILERAERGPVFFKDMSYYVVPHIFTDSAFVDRLTHTFLVRDPKASIVSYAKIDPDLTSEEVGLEAQWQHAAFLLARIGKPPLIVRSEDVQANPVEQLRRYWEVTGLAYKPEALEWNEAAPVDWQQVSGWHREVMASKTISPLTAQRIKETEASFEKLVTAQPRFKEFYEHHAPYYEKLLELRMKP